MRALFGILGLLLTLAIVGSLVRTQLKALNPAPGAPAAGVAASPPGTAGERGGRLDAMPGAVAADPGLAGTVPAGPQSVQRQVADDVNRLMQQAPARGEER
jgi:hypothetical protein